MTARRIRVVLADDHPVVLQGLVSFLSPEGEFEIVATCLSGQACIDALREHRPDVAVIDLAIPDLHGLKIIAAAVQYKLPTRMVLISAAPTDAELAAAIDLGVYGIVLKDAAPDTLVQAIRTVAAGRRWLARELGQAAPEQSRGTAAAPEMRSLTERERQVAELVAHGLGNREVGARLGIAEGTVKLHLHSIYKKLALGNRTALARLFMSRRGRGFD
jgi:DNA-binding NarL/FixJ family response regulator